MFGFRGAQGAVNQFRNEKAKARLAGYLQSLFVKIFEKLICLLFKIVQAAPSCREFSAPAEIVYCSVTGSPELQHGPAPVLFGLPRDLLFNIHMPLNFTQYAVFRRSGAEIFLKKHPKGNYLSSVLLILFCN